MGQEVTLRVQCRSAATPSSAWPDLCCLRPSQFCLVRGHLRRPRSLAVRPRRGARSALQQSRAWPPGSGGSRLNRVGNLLGRPIRSIHRFTIYFGLGGAVPRHGSGRARVREPGNLGPPGYRNLDRHRHTWLRWHLPGKNSHHPARRYKHAGIPGFPRWWRQP
jgi:hypothetical protein